MRVNDSFQHLYYLLIISSGSEIFDQILAVLLSTSMFVGGVVGFVLDVTIPGNII